MKKNILLTLLIVLLTVGCNKNNSNNEPTNQNNTTNNNQTETKEETTLNNLMNAKESPEKDFYVVDLGNGEHQVLGYHGDDEVVVIPESLGITTIATYVFGSTSIVKAVRLSNTINTIKQGHLA